MNEYEYNICRVNVCPMIVILLFLIKCGVVQFCFVYLKISYIFRYFCEGHTLHNHNPLTKRSSD